MSEKPSIRMVRRGAFLVPVAPMDSERLDEFPVGKPLNVKVTQARSVPQHRLYWSVLSLVCENVDSLTPEVLHGLIKLRLGYAVEVRTKRGVDRVPGSISFSAMSQEEFRKFFDRAVDFICTQVIPILDKPSLEARAREMLGEEVAA